MTDHPITVPGTFPQPKANMKVTLDSLNKYKAQTKPKNMDFLRKFIHWF